MKLKPIPRSKAKTAYGLVSDVIRAMDEEPKRVDMGLWINAKLPKDGGPACGTIGCFAGWVSLLAGKRPSLHAVGDAEGIAKHMLGSGCRYYDPAAHSFLSSGYVFNASGDDLRGSPGTRQYARSVIARIKRFQKTNAAYLKARKLASVR